MTAHVAPPFSETQWRRIHALLKDLDNRQTLWLSGYLRAVGDQNRAAPGRFGRWREIALPAREITAQPQGLAVVQVL